MANPQLQRQSRKVLKRTEQQAKAAKGDLAMFQAMLPDEVGYIDAPEGRKTSSLTQDELRASVPLQNAKKMFALDLTEERAGSYIGRYTRNGRHLLMASERGHYAAFDWQTGKLHCEGRLEEGEQVRDACWLHNETFFALAQSNFVYMYDHAGTEVHRLKKHQHVLRMDFLPWHFLLATGSADGFLRYQDVSMGTLVAEHSFKQAGRSGTHATMGKCTAMAQNPQTAVIHVGHVNGVVSLWSPAMNTPLAQMKCHPGPVQSVVVDYLGQKMASAGFDGRIKLWDLRTYGLLGEVRSHRAVSDMAFSQRGLLAVGHGPHVSMWSTDSFASPTNSTYAPKSEPYMTHLLPSMAVQSVRFCPFEDVLGVGHSAGFSSLLVPGSGEPNYDALDANPYANVRQRQESEVHALLEKLPPDTIALNVAHTIGQVARDHQREVVPARKLLAQLQAPRRPRRSKPSRHAKRENIIDDRKLDSARLEIVRRTHKESEDSSSALSRFIVKSA